MSRATRSASATEKTGGVVRRASKARLGACLKLLQDVLRRGHLEFARGFNVHVRRHPVLDDDGKALTPRAHAEAGGIQLEPERLGVLAIAVGQHQDLLADAAGLA